ncbi:MAG TPA: GNAT family N-acetyltransferase [Candidatus Dormibacteraeota bacterium]|nr:GNAT family N-acetyltransferase [Candidatus Dormibacteraeota bacterium]
MKVQSRVQVLAPPDRAAWDALVASALEATVFHTSAWAELWLQEWRGARWVAFVIQDDAGYAAGIPAIVRNRGIGRTVFSMPYGTYGGPILRQGLSDPVSARAELLEAFARRAGSRWTLRSEMTWYQGSVPEIPEALRPSESFTHVLPLSLDFEALARGFHPSARRLVRQAEESGLTIRAASGEEDVRAFYDLALRTVRRRGGNPKPYSLYGRIHRELVPKGLARYHLVHHGDRPIAGSLHLFHEGVAMNWLPVSLESSWHLRPNNFLIARTLETLCGAGYVEYNFGASPHDAAGLIRFKESWGAVPRPLAVAGRRSSVHRKLRG